MKFEIIEESKELMIYQKDQHDLDIQAKEIQVSCQDTYNIAKDMITKCRTLEEKISEVLDPDIKRFHGLHKEALSKKKQFTEPLKDIESKLKEKMKVWYQEQIKKQQEEQLRLYEQAKQQEDDLKDFGINAVVQAEKVQEIDANGVQYQSKWKYTIIDEYAIPREFLMVDESKIKKHIQALKSESHIPGVKVYEDKIVKVSN